MEVSVCVVPRRDVQIIDSQVINVFLASPSATEPKL